MSVATAFAVTDTPRAARALVRSAEYFGWDLRLLTGRLAIRAVRIIAELEVVAAAAATTAANVLVVIILSVAVGRTSQVQ